MYQNIEFVKFLLERGFVFSFFNDGGKWKFYGSLLSFFFFVFQVFLKGIVFQVFRVFVGGRFDFLKQGMIILVIIMVYD